MRMTSLMKTTAIVFTFLALFCGQFVGAAEQRPAMSSVKRGVMFGGIFFFLLKASSLLFLSGSVFPSSKKNVFPAGELRFCCSTCYPCMAGARAPDSTS